MRLGTRPIGTTFNVGLAFDHTSCVGVFDGGKRTGELCKKEQASEAVNHDRKQCNRFLSDMDW